MLSFFKAVKQSIIKLCAKLRGRLPMFPNAGLVPLLVADCFATGGNKWGKNWIALLGGRFWHFDRYRFRKLAAKIQQNGGWFAGEVSGFFALDQKHC